MKPLLDIQSLSLAFRTNGAEINVLEKMQIQVFPGETLGLVGESGSGKSVTALAALRLLPATAHITSGNIYFAESNVLKMCSRELQALRGRQMGLIIQDSGSALNPMRSIGSQLSGVLRYHFHHSAKEARQKALDLLDKVQLPDAGRLYSSYPYQLSGGMRQRVLIALALACRPRLLIADEPTSALDVSVQNQILHLLQSLKQEFKLALLLISHDLPMVSQVADRVAVAYAGTIVEQNSTEQLFSRPLHPYSVALLNLMPQWRRDTTAQALADPLPGSVPDLLNRPSGCAFHPRCPLADDACRKETPPIRQQNNGGFVRCLKKG